MEDTRILNRLTIKEIAATGFVVRIIVYCYGGLLPEAGTAGFCR